MNRREASNLCIEEVEKLTPAQAWEYLQALNMDLAGSKPEDAADLLKEGFPMGCMPGLLEQIALRVIIKEQANAS